MERLERASDAREETTNELESELAKAVNDDNGTARAPGIAVETVVKDQTFDSSAAVLEVGSANNDAEASFQSIEKTIEEVMDREGSFSTDLYSLLMIWSCYLKRNLMYKTSSVNGTSLFVLSKPNSSNEL